MRAVVYCRVSTKEQTENLSLPTQEKACREYCARQGLEVDRVFVEQGESAKTTDRTRLTQMLAYCAENRRRLQFVVVYSLSRFARDNTGHFAMRAHLQRLGIALRSVTEPIDDTATGKLMEAMLAGFAQFDNDVRSERTVAGMRAAFERGQWPFPAPVGHLVVVGADGRKTLAVDPVIGPLVGQAFELIAGGGITQAEVLRRVTALGLRSRQGRRLNKQSLRQLLTNPLYAGRLVVPKWGLERRADFAPAVSEELFDRVQLMLGGGPQLAKVHARSNPDFPLRHFVRCAACDKPMTAYWAQGRTEKYPYYRCPKNCVNARKERVEGAFVELLERMRPKARYIKLFNAIVEDVWKQQHAGAADLRAAAERKLAALRTRKEQLVDAYVYKQALDKDTYQEQIEKLRADLTVTEIDLAEAKVDELDLEGLLGFAETLLTDTPRLWQLASLEQRQRLQAVLFPAGVTYDANAGVRTAVTCLAYTVFEAIAGGKSDLAPHSHPGLNQVRAWVKDLGVLRGVFERAA